MTSPLGTPELDEMHDYEDKRDEYECIDIQCGHYDGDCCTLGACLDPPIDYDPRYEDGDYAHDSAKEDGR